ncbi:MAG: hypothetical protein KY442_12745, partial [Proteobacteria bacterium]|nr:hypothetical protein [Pseudomonadota bacterium]
FGRIGVKVWIYTGDQIGSGEEAEAQRAMDRARALAEGRPVDDRPRRKSARKAASVAKKVTGVGKKPQTDPATQAQQAQAKQGDVAEQPVVPSEDVPADTSNAPASPKAPAGAGHETPASVTEAGETPKSDVEQATTQSLPPQSGAMKPEDVTGATQDAEQAPDGPDATGGAAPGDKPVADEVAPGDTVADDIGKSDDELATPPAGDDAAAGTATDEGEGN